MSKTRRERCVGLCFSLEMYLGFSIPRILKNCLSKTKIISGIVSILIDSANYIILPLFQTGV